MKMFEQLRLYCRELRAARCERIGHDRVVAERSGIKVSHKPGVAAYRVVEDRIQCARCGRGLSPWAIRSETPMLFTDVSLKTYEELDREGVMWEKNAGAIHAAHGRQA
jgi:hypothetical protein